MGTSVRPETNAYPTSKQLDCSTAFKECHDSSLAFLPVPAVPDKRCDLNRLMQRHSIR
jgi:hypothetical protein